MGKINLIYCILGCILGGIKALRSKYKAQLPLASTTASIIEANAEGKRDGSPLFRRSETIDFRLVIG